MKLNDLSRIGGGIIGISYFVGNYCLFSYLNRVEATVPLDATFWLNASILIFIATFLIWVPLGGLTWIIFCCLEYSWRFIAFGGQWKLFPFGFRESFVSLDGLKKNFPGFQEISGVLRNGLPFFVLFSVASWYNCIQGEAFYAINPVWGFCIVWIVYYLLRISWLNGTFFSLIKRKKLEAFKTPFSRRLLALFTVWIPLVSVYIFYMEFIEHEFNLSAKGIFLQLFYILTFTLFFLPAWWYVVLFVRGIKGIWSKRHLTRIVIINFLILWVLLYLFGDLWGKTALRFLRVGGGMEFSFRWDRKCANSIPDEWKTAFCNGTDCRGNLILKTGEEILLKVPSLEHPVSVPRYCIMEI